MRVQIRPEMFKWARERSGKSIYELIRGYPKIELWETGEVVPTLKQLEGFAKKNHLPVGYLFLPEPPIEAIPIPDCRTVGNRFIDHPSPDLLDTIYICQQRQKWYYDFALTNNIELLSFIGTANIDNDVVATAGDIRNLLKINIEERHHFPTWQEALSRFISQADSAGILVMISSVVGNNNHRKLDIEEFRGFTLSDDLAPLIFINGSDSKSAQMFTLAHEIAHLWLGESALSDINPAEQPSHVTEKWCDLVAAELLVPRSAFIEEYRQGVSLETEINRLARHFKVSTLVILRRIYDSGLLSQADFWHAFNLQLEYLKNLPKRSGGDFYNSQSSRLSKRFARAIVTSTFAGYSSFTEAFRLLGIKKMSTFSDLANRLGVII